MIKQKQLYCDILLVKIHAVWAKLALDQGVKPIKWYWRIHVKYGAQVKTGARMPPEVDSYILTLI